MDFESGKIKEEELKAFFEKKNVKFIVLHGSMASGKKQEDSDVDVAVYSNNKKSMYEDLDDYNELLENLASFFGIKEDKIDISDLASDNILLRYEITVKGKLLYGNEDDYEDFKAFAFREYIDAKPLFELEDFLIKKRQKIIGEILQK